MTKEELKEKRGAKTQDEMAAELKTPVSTYRKWEQGVRKVPGWVENHFHRSHVVIPGLDLNEIIDLADIARKMGIGVDELTSRFIKEGIARNRAKE